MNFKYSGLYCSTLNQNVNLIVFFESSERDTLLNYDSS